MAKKKQVIKRTFDSYLYTGLSEIETTGDWIAYLKKFDSDSPEMKEKMSKEQVEPSFYRPIIKSQRERAHQEKLRHNLVIFKRAYGKAFRRYPWLRHLATGLDAGTVKRERGIIV